MTGTLEFLEIDKGVKFKLAVPIVVTLHRNNSYLCNFHENVQKYVYVKLKSIFTVPLSFQFCGMENRQVKKFIRSTNRTLKVSLLV